MKNMFLFSTQIFVQRRLKRQKRNLVVIFLSLSFFCFFILFPQESWGYSCSDYGNQNLSDSETQEVVKKCDQEIAALEKKIDQKKKEGLDVQGELNELERGITFLIQGMEIKRKNLEEMEKKIEQNTQKIKELKKQKELLLEEIRGLLVEKNKLDSFSFIEILLGKGSVGDFMIHLKFVSLMEREIVTVFGEVQEKEREVEKINKELNGDAGKERGLLENLESERESYHANLQRKEDALALISRAKKEISSDISKKEQIRNTLLGRSYALSSGKSITFGQAYNILRPYQSSLKMDEAFILAVLFQESKGVAGGEVKIGANIGSCFYNNVNKNGNERNGYQVMSKSQQKNFFTIMSYVGIAPEKQKVSCPIPVDGAYGGAMGPAQFMPNTWMEISTGLSRALGVSKKDLSPFKNRDALLGSGMYLKKQYYGNTCSDYVKKNKHLSSEKTLRERCAAARYYAGSGWENHKFGYAQEVINKANQFRSDIAIINE